MAAVRSFDLPPVNCREILRYAGAKAETPELTALLEEALAEATPVFTGKVCWSEFPVIHGDSGLDLGFTTVRSAALDKNLQDCSRIILFAATLGLGLDRLIGRYSRLSPAKALMLQAIGTERIEALCDTFCEHIRRETGLHSRPRFSPGYGDFPLSIQSDIFRALDCSRTIGLTLNSSLLMSPSKSVTAVIGLSACPSDNCPTGCQSCGKTDCIHRR